MAAFLQFLICVPVIKYLMQSVECVIAVFGKCPLCGNRKMSIIFAKNAAVQT